MKISNALRMPVAAMFLLTGCASKFEISEQQSKCRSENASFPSYSECLKLALHKGSTPPKSGRVKEFFNEIDLLKYQLSEGYIKESDAYARLEMKRKALRADEEKDNKTAAAVFAGALLVGAAAYAASKGGGGGYDDSDDYAWDQFDAPYGAGYQWRCRSKPSGQFAPDYQCAGSPKIDTTWPGK